MKANQQGPCLQSMENKVCLEDKEFLRSEVHVRSLENFIKGTTEPKTTNKSFQTSVATRFELTTREQV